MTPEAARVLATAFALEAAGLDGSFHFRVAAALEVQPAATVETPRREHPHGWVGVRRRARGLSQRELARRAGIGAYTLNLIEGGSTNRMSRSVRERLERALQEEAVA